MTKKPDETAKTEQAAITKRAGIVAAGTLCSRVLGLVRDQVLAATFSSIATDVFFIAFLIPNTLRALLAEGAMQNGVLPVLTEEKEQRGANHAAKLFSELRGLSLLLLAIVSLLGVIFAEPIVLLFAGGFREHSGQFERTVRVTQWVFPYIFFMGTAALGAAALNTHRRFGVTSFAPGLLNVAFVSAAIALPAVFHALGSDPLYALVVGVLFGGILQVVAQWPSLRAIGYMTWPRLSLRSAGVREVLRRMGPVLFGFGVYYVDVLAARQMLTSLEVGSVSYYTWALRLCDFPQGIFVMAVSTATLPSLSSMAAKRDVGGLRETFLSSLRLSLFVALPASAFFVTFAEPLVSLAFERGAFDRLTAHETARALVAQGLGVFLVAAVRQVVIVFYALGDTRSPVLIAATDFCIFFGSALLLRESFGHVGISWAVTIASFVQVCLLLVVLRQKLPGLRVSELLRSTRKTTFATLAAAAGGYGALLGTRRTVQLVLGARDANVSPGIVEQLLLFTLPALAFGSLFFICAGLQKSEELRRLTEPLLRRLRH